MDKTSWTPRSSKKMGKHAPRFCSESQYRNGQDFLDTAWFPEDGQTCSKVSRKFERKFYADDLQNFTFEQGTYIKWSLRNSFARVKYVF